MVLKKESRFSLTSHWKKECDYIRQNYLDIAIYIFGSYGSTKCGLRQLQASLLKECKRSKVGVHTASPGMVLTDLLLR